MGGRFLTKGIGASRSYEAIKNHLVLFRLTPRRMGSLEGPAITLSASPSAHYIHLAAPQQTMGESGRPDCTTPRAV